MLLYIITSFRQNHQNFRYRVGLTSQIFTCEVEKEIAICSLHICSSSVLKKRSRTHTLFWTFHQIFFLKIFKIAKGILKHFRSVHYLFLFYTMFSTHLYTSSKLYLKDLTEIRNLNMQIQIMIKVENINCINTNFLLQ